MTSTGCTRQAERPGPGAHAVERRRAKRYPALGAVDCDVLPGGRPQPARAVVDLSPLGAGLLLGHAALPGVTLKLALTNARCMLRHAVRLRVRRCHPEPGGAWLVGGEFAAPLPPKVWQALLG
jgi:hypothetical protein